MNELEFAPPKINFKLQLILFFVTGTLWAPIFNLICLLQLNKLAEIISQKGIEIKRTMPVMYFLIALTFIGAPIVFYHRYKLLREYLQVMEQKLGPFVEVETDRKEARDEPKRLYSITPGKFVGYAISTFFVLALFVVSYTIPIYYLIANPTWGSDALMILFPFGMGSTFTSLGFSVRTIKEEQMWVKAFNNLAKETSEIK